MPNRFRLTLLSSLLCAFAACRESGEGPVGQAGGHAATGPGKAASSKLDRASVPSGPATVRQVRDDGSLLLDSGRTVSLQGVELPDAVVRSAGMGKRLRTFVEQRLASTDGKVWLVVDGPDPRGITDGVAMLHQWSDEQVRSINEAVLQAGLAVFRGWTVEVTRRDQLFAATQTAQRLRNGWFESRHPGRLQTVGYLNGAVIGLYHQVEAKNYHRHLSELAEAGFRHVSFLFPGFLDKVDSVEIRRDLARTVTDARLIETIGYAKQRGMSVMLLPIVLLRNPGEDDWRGVLKPADPERWWLNYTRFLNHYLDIAESTGVDLFSVGSELGSLEGQTANWNRLILNARGRFRGLLTYSANWDHAHIAEFFPALDAVGMSAYFELTKKLDPTVEELVAAWRQVARHLGELAQRHGRPLILTELGYASQDGVNREPWNYTLNTDEIDLQEQSDCFEAFCRVASEMKFLSGAYFYDYFGNGGEGGAEDWSYSPRGKPAMDQWAKWAKWRRGR